MYFTFFIILNKQISGIRISYFFWYFMIIFSFPATSCQTIYPIDHIVNMGVSVIQLLFYQFFRRISFHLNVSQIQHYDFLISERNRAPHFRHNQDLYYLQFFFLILSYVFIRKSKQLRFLHLQLMFTRLFYLNIIKKFIIQFYFLTYFAFNRFYFRIIKLFGCQNIQWQTAG